MCSTRQALRSIEDWSKGSARAGSRCVASSFSAKSASAVAWRASVSTSPAPRGRSEIRSRLRCAQWLAPSMSRASRAMTEFLGRHRHQPQHAPPAPRAPRRSIAIEGSGNPTIPMAGSAGGAPATRRIPSHAARRPCRCQYHCSRSGTRRAPILSRGFRLDALQHLDRGIGEQPRLGQRVEAACAIQLSTRTASSTTTSRCRSSSAARHAPHHAASRTRNCRGGVADIVGHHHAMASSSGPVGTNSTTRSPGSADQPGQHLVHDQRPRATTVLRPRRSSACSRRSCRSWISPS